MNEIEEKIKNIQKDITAISDSMGLGFPYVENNKRNLLMCLEFALSTLYEVKQSLAQDSEDQREITEQQALNKLAERFPMTTNQIVSTLEMSQTGVNHESVEVPRFIKYAMQRYNSLQEMLTEEYYNESYYEIDEDDVFCWIDKNFNLLCRAWLDGYTVVKEPLYIISKPLEANEIFKNYFVGFVGSLEPLMDCRKKEAYKFSDFEQAKAVAFLICGNVEEDES